MAKRLVFLFTIIFTTVSIFNITSFAAIQITDDRLEVIQAARNNQLAEEVFMHDFNEKLSRQELSMLMVIMLQKLSYKNIRSAAQVLKVFYEYKDKPQPEPVYIPYINLAGKTGIIESASSSKFNPRGLVTRQLFASVLLKAIILAKPFNKYDLREDVIFSDREKIYDWAMPGIIFSYRNQYLVTTDKNEINPKGYVTRYQALEIIYRVLVGEKAIVKLNQEELKRLKGGTPLIPVKGNNSKWGYKDGNGKVIIAPQFEMVKPFSEGYAAVCINNKWGFTDTFGNIIYKPEFDSVHDFHNGFAAVAAGAKFGYLDNTGKLAIKLQFYNDSEFQSQLYDYSDNSAFVKLGANKYRLIDKYGKALYKQEINFARCFSEALALIKVNNKFCYIDKRGKVIIKLNPDVINCGDFLNNRAVILLKNNQYRYIDKKGKILKDKVNDNIVLN